MSTVNVRVSPGRVGITEVAGIAVGVSAWVGCSDETAAGGEMAVGVGVDDV